MHQGVDVLSGALKAGGWEEIPEPNEAPTKKNHTFGSTTYMFADGERGGPLATYLVSAAGRDNFKLLTGLSVRRALRDGGHVTGLELDCLAEEGGLGSIPLTADTGRAIFAAGTFGSAKLLLRSEFFFTRLCLRILHETNWLKVVSDLPINLRSSRIPSPTARTSLTPQSGLTYLSATTWLTTLT